MNRVICGRRVGVAVRAVFGAVLSALVLGGCGDDGGDNPGNNNPETNPSACGTPTPAKTEFTDIRDGKVYKKVTIGSKTWMAENLNYEADASVCYKNSPDSCAKYGRLYDWSTAMGIDTGYNTSLWGGSGAKQGVCPAGWHVAIKAEWDSLFYFACGAPLASREAGMKLKTISGWSNNGTDEYGFSALPGGTVGGVGNTFIYAGDNGFWWIGTEKNAEDAWFATIFGQNAIQYAGSGASSLKFHKSAIRCVED